MHFGEAAYLKSGTQFNYTVDSTKYIDWTIGPLYDFKVGDTQIIEKKADRTATISTGHSYINLPDQEYELFKQEIVKVEGFECGNAEGFGPLCTTTRECSSVALELQPMSFGLGKNIELTIQPAAYLINYATFESDVRCYTAVTLATPDPDGSKPESTIILGDVFLRNYRTVLYYYDPPIVMLSKNEASHSIIRRTDLTQQAVVLTTLGTLLISFIIFVIVWKCYLNKKCCQK
jgi:hypothetical protein